MEQYEKLKGIFNSSSFLIDLIEKYEENRKMIDIVINDNKILY